MRKILTLALVSAALFAACVTTGKNFDIAHVREIHNKTTTKSQVQSWFGYPYMTGIDNGDEAWTYNFTKDNGQLNKTLYIVFDKAGNVKSFTFSTSFPEEMVLQ